MDTPVSTLERKDEVLLPGYCVKCKATQPVGWSAVIRMKNGRTAAKGRCRGTDAVGRECGTGAYTFNGATIHKVHERLKQINSQPQSQCNPSTTA